MLAFLFNFFFFFSFILFNTSVTSDVTVTVIVTSHKITKKNIKGFGRMLLYNMCNIC